MRDEQRRRYPHRAGHMWWYEGGEGIEVYGPGGMACVIRWSVLEHALRRWRPGKRPATPHNSAMPKCRCKRVLVELVQSTICGKCGGVVFMRGTSA